MKNRHLNALVAVPKNDDFVHIFKVGSSKEMGVFYPPDERSEEGGLKVPISLLLTSATAQT